MLFGGQAERATRNLATVATSSAQRMRLNYNPINGKYDISDWVEETMSSPRVMGDSILLPNGKVVILNGAQVRFEGVSRSLVGQVASKRFVTHLV